MLLPAFLLSAQLLSAQSNIPKLRIGYSVSIEKITPESMVYAKANGIDCIEIAGISTWFEKGSRHFVKSDKEIEAQLRAVKRGDHSCRNRNLVGTHALWKNH